MTDNSRFHPPGRLTIPDASWVARVLARFFWTEHIHRGQGDLYLLRFVLWGEVRTEPPRRSWTERLTFGWRVYLHCFYRSDEDQDPHDHPAAFLTGVLAGGYRDEEWEPGAMHRAEYERGSSWVSYRDRWRPRFVRAVHVMTRWSWAWRRAQHLHRVRLIDPTRCTWTLVLFGPRRWTWGFETVDGPVPWRTYLERQKENA